MTDDTESPARRLFRLIKVVDGQGNERNLTDDEIDGMFSTFKGIEALEAEDPWESLEGQLRDHFDDIVVTKAHGYCPVQVHGTIDGEGFYFRARGEHASLSVGGHDVIGQPLRYAEARVTEEAFAAGWMMPSEVAQVFVVLHANLQNETEEARRERAEIYARQIDAIIAGMRSKTDDQPLLMTDDQAFLANDDRTTDQPPLGDDG